MPIAPPLGTSWGYGIILGLGSLFALGMVSVTGFFGVITTYVLTLSPGACHMDPKAV
jgi:hypothetical protein